MTPDQTIFPGQTIFMEGKAGFGVLLVHGLGGTPVELKTFARQLNQTGATVLCCQLAGHCGSEDDLKATSWQDWYASVAAALEKLEERCDTIVAGGLSMGSILAARLAREEPERVHGLVMLAPTLRYDGWSIPWYSDLLKVLMWLPFGRNYKFVEHDPYGVKDERIRSLVVRAMTSGDSTNAGLLATPSQALREMWRLVAELKPGLSRITQPTLIIHARNDDVAHLRNAFYLQKHLGGPVEMLVLEDSYHLITVDRQRGLVGRRAAAFVTALAATRQRAPEPLRHAG